MSVPSTTGQQEHGQQVVTVHGEQQATGGHQVTGGQQVVGGQTGPAYDVVVVGRQG